jgi:5'-3' exonuclease
MTCTMLLDTYSLMYRAFFALPASIRDPDGGPVNAVHGYLDMTARLIGGYRPDRLVHVFDDAIRPAERVRAYPGYKASRPPDPEVLPPQFPLLERALDALGAERAVAPGWEADDAIATLCARARRGERIDVVTGDRDLLALVRDADPTVRVLFTVRGVSDLAAYDETAVEAKYGVPPDRYTLLAMLRGDPSDGLPGVPGVGEKTASKLAAAHPSLSSLLAGADSLPPKLARQVLAAAPYLQAMTAVVPARTDVDLIVRSSPPDEARLAELSGRGLGGPIRRLTLALGENG